jgi:hypothetical protein
MTKKHDLSHLNIPCNSAGHGKMVLIEIRPESLFFFETALYQCTICGQKKTAVWHPESLLSRVELIVEEEN